MAITMTPEGRAALERLSAASGIASGQFVAKLVHDSIPVIDAMTQAFTVAKTHPERALEGFKDVIASAMVQGAQTSLELNQPTHTKLRKRP